MTYARRTDGNQEPIVSALRSMGAFVQPLTSVKCGCPDLLVGWRQRWFLLEVKRDSRAKLTQDERDWIASVAGRAPVFVITSAMEAINFMQGVKP